MINGGLRKFGSDDRHHAGAADEKGEKDEDRENDGKFVHRSVAIGYNGSVYETNSHFWSRRGDCGYPGVGITAGMATKDR